MDYEYFKELFQDVKRRAKYRAIACLLCIPIWTIFTQLGDRQETWFSQGDAIGTVILLVLAFFFGDKSTKADMNIRRVVRLQNQTKLTVTLEKVFHDDKKIEEPEEIARLVKNHIAHLGKVEVTYETPLAKKKL